MEFTHSWLIYIIGNLCILAFRFNVSTYEVISISKWLGLLASSFHQWTPRAEIARCLPGRGWSTRISALPWIRNCYYRLSWNTYICCQLNSGLSTYGNWEVLLGRRPVLVARMGPPCSRLNEFGGDGRLGVGSYNLGNKWCYSPKISLHTTPQRKSSMVNINTPASDAFPHHLPYSVQRRPTTLMQWHPPHSSIHLPISTHSWPYMKHGMALTTFTTRTHLWKLRQV